MFNNRRDAGERLGKALEKYKDKGVFVFGIPRGGVEVAYYVALHLKAHLSVIVSRKLPYADNPEAGFGAIAEDGSIFIFDEALGFLSRKEIDQIIEAQKKEMKRRVDLYRQGKAFEDIAGKTVILIDDGIAMGSTMRAAVMLCRNKKAKKIIVASPVSGTDTFEEFKKIADEVVVLEMPRFFQAVAQAYYDWYDVSDEEVLGFIEKWKHEQS
ncbi:MAG TPA: phosphoribosyltransferase family protein [Candidatus Omnitrophota bacterium]|nr:phosphoribosyltransferase family protein [Candidatus Omnitrophota bacterium]